MKMNLADELADDLDDKINEKVASAVGPYQTETVEDLQDVAETLSHVSEEINGLALDVEGLIEKAYLRRGRTIFGDALTASQITAQRVELGCEWVATVFCDCGAGEFCDECGVEAIPAIKDAVEKFLKT
jgi:hypothetical protein